MILCFLSHPCIIHSNPVAWAWYSDPPTANLGPAQMSGYLSALEAQYYSLIAYCVTFLAPNVGLEYIFEWNKDKEQSYMLVCCT